MDTKTPSIPSKHHDRKEQQQRKSERSPEPVSLPPLASVSSGNRQLQQNKSKNQSTSVPWTRGPPYVSRNSEHLKRRPYRVLHIGATPLMHACQQADRSRVLRLLKEQEETVGYRDRTLRNALHYCMDAGTGGAVASAAPELVNAPDAEGHTPLHLAVIAGDTQLVAVLLANGADVNAKDLEGHSVLHWATVCGEAECVRLVLAAGARPSTPDLRGGSPLHYAAQCCGAAATAELSVPKKVGLKVLQTLLEFGADVNAKDEDGRQPILWAASAGSVEAVLALARAGGSAAAGATDKDGLTALHCAASRGHARCVEALVNLCGSHPDHVDDNGCSALHYAATLGHADATALLLRLGADPNRQDRKGRTPALCAAAKGQLETLKILAQHGGSLHARTVRGTGVAHEAVLSGRIELIEWLAKKRPSTLDVATHDGKTPLHVAALHGFLDVCKVLLDNGARINAVLHTSKSGPMTALDAALYRGHRDCAKLVQMHGGTTAQHLRTHKTAPNRVFAAKLRAKRGDSSTESESSSERRGRCHRESDLYFEERWIEKRTRRRAGGRSPRKIKYRRGSRSFSEEEIRLGKTSRRRDRGRRARSESARYEDSYRLERSDRKSGVNRCGPGRRHEYGESSSESNNDTEDNENDFKEREQKVSRSKDDGRNDETRKSSKSSEFKKTGSSENGEDVEESDEDERSLSDDSLEVVVVKKSLEKTSEKVHISGRKSKTPRETSKQTRVMETRHKSSRRKSKTGRSSSRTEETEEKEPERGKTKRKSRTSLGSDGARVESEKQSTETKDASSFDGKRKERESQFRKDVTDSTSQETVERVTVTALVHKDQAPDTPKEEKIRRKDSRVSGGSKRDSKESGDGTESGEFRGTIPRNEMDEILEKADELQNALMTKAADLKKDVEDIRRQMTTSESSPEGDQAAEERVEGSKGSAGTAEEASEESDEQLTVKGRRSGNTESPTTSENSQQEFSRLQSQQEKETSRKNSGADDDEKGDFNEDAETKESPEKSSKSSLGRSEDEAIEKDEKSASSDDKSRKQNTNEGSSGSEKLQTRPSTAKPKTAQSRRESVSSAAEEKIPSDKSVDQSQEKRDDREKSVESIVSISKVEAEDETLQRSENIEESSEKRPDDVKTVEATTKEDITKAVDDKHSQDEAKDVSDKDKESDSPAVAEKSDKSSGETETPKQEEESGLQSSGKSRFIDGTSSGSGKSSRVESRSRPATGRNNGRRKSGSSKSPSKRSLFESSEERSPDRSAIVAVIESPEWDEDDDEEQIEKEIRDAVGDEGEEGETEHEDEDGLGVLRVLPSTSEEETPRITNKLLKISKGDSLPRVERRLRVKHEGAESPQGLRGIRGGRAKQRRDSGGRDSGIEPSPRVSKIPKRNIKCYPNTEKQQALNMETITRDVQISLRRYHLERKIFFQLMELKRLQIRHGRANEHVLVKRQVESFHKAGMAGPTLGVAKYDQPLTFRHFEAFLYEQLRRLQRRPATPDFCTEAKQCTQKTHRCHHATSAYTSVPVYTYLGGGGQEREEGLLPRIESRGKGQMTVEVTRGEEKQVIELPAEKLDRTKRYYVTFTVRGEGPDSESSSGGMKGRSNAQRNTKSV